MKASPLRRGPRSRKMDTAEMVLAMLPDYDNLTLSFALIPKSLATLNTVYNEETGKYEYVMNGEKYTYTENKSTIEFWDNVLKAGDGRFEFISHTMTHSYWGTNDEGGTFSYVSDGEVKTVVLPVGSASAEIYASIQILNDLYGIDMKTLVEPGIGVEKNDVTIDGVTYESYHKYYLQLISKAYEEGVLIGVRGNGFGDTAVSPDKVVTPEMLADVAERLDINALTARHTQNVENWKKYIDYATDVGGWAVFCLHKIIADGTDDTNIHIFESQADELFRYTDNENVWVATYTEATKYYTEWSTAEVSVECNDGVISVTLTDAENNEVYDEALTVKVTVPTGWTECIVGDKTVEVMVDENGESFVYVNIVPDSGVVTITSK